MFDSRREIGGEVGGLSIQLNVQISTWGGWTNNTHLMMVLVNLLHFCEELGVDERDVRYG
jgi:hypothetical protein